VADQGAEGLLSPFLRDQRIKAALPYLRGDVLDIGCGSGYLARHVDASHYVGVDIDTTSLILARTKFPEHHFLLLDDLTTNEFDVIVALAVIEHVPEPVSFLVSLRDKLADNSESRIICTTPHPTMEWIHGLGARVGIFSRSANEEHETLLDRKILSETGEKAGLELKHYARFLFGANQIAIYARK